MIASASTTAVVVPSPATSEVLLATWLTILAPMFSNGLGRSISLETVTPSLVTFGEPKDFWSITFRPVGPSVTLTAAASLLTPASIAARASVSYIICFAAIVLRSLLTGRPAGVPAMRQAVGYFSMTARTSRLAQDHELLAVDLDLRAGVLAVEHLVALLHAHLAALAAVQQLARADGDDLAALRLFLGRVRQDDPAGGLLLGLATA